MQFIYNYKIRVQCYEIQAQCPTLRSRSNAKLQLDVIALNNAKGRTIWYLGGGARKNM